MEYVEQELITLPKHPIIGRVRVVQFEDTKGVIIIHISKKNRQYNDQKKKYKRTNNDLQKTVVIVSQILFQYTKLIQENTL